MANRRMIVKDLSYSEAFSSLSDFAQVLYLMTTPHLDDFGKIDGSPTALKARVLPLSKRNPGLIEKAIKELSSAGLVDSYEVEGHKVIKYLTFEEDQTGLDKRTKSKYPDNPRSSEKFTEVLRTSSPTEPNITEKNLTEFNKTEQKEEESIAVKKIPYKGSIEEVGNTYPTSEENPTTGKSSTKRAFADRNPDTFVPETREETAAVEIWRKIEPNNKMSFYSTYLKPIRRGFPPDLLYQTWSEVKSDPKVKNPGAVMNKRIKDWFESKGIAYP